MSKTKITERNKMTLPGGEREMNYADATFPGLFLRVTPANASAFVHCYSHGGKQRKTRSGVLGHSLPGMTGRYAHLKVDRARECIEAVSTEIATAMASPH